MGVLTPKSSCTLISPLETDSAMCSKWTVSPLIKTPIAIMESKGLELSGAAVNLVRSVVDAPSKSPEGRPAEAA